MLNNQTHWHTKNNNNNNIKNNNNNCKFKTNAVKAKPHLSDLTMNQTPDQF